jgi:hypothetical protein
MNTVTSSDGPVNHLVKLSKVKDYFEYYWGKCTDYTNLSTEEWLSIPQQKLLGATAGKVYHDGFGVVTKIRDNTQYYPTSIWLYMISVQLSKIGQHVAFVGRTAIVDDLLGSQLLIGSLVRDMMRLCFMLEKKYYP